MWCGKYGKRDDEQRDGVRVRQGDVWGRLSIRCMAGGSRRSKVVNECVDSSVRQSSGPSGEMRRLGSIMAPGALWEDKRKLWWK